MAKKAIKRKRFAPKNLVELFSSPRRWMQRDFSDGHGRYCLLGGLSRIYKDGTFERTAARIRLLGAIESISAGWFRGIAQFNDAPTTTFADIQRVVRKTRV